MSKIVKMILPFVLAALAPVAAFFGVLGVLALLADSPATTLSGFGPLVVGGLIVSCAHVLLLGAPSVWMLYKLHLFRLRPVLMAGFIAGCLPSAIWDWPFDIPRWGSAIGYPYDGVFAPVPAYEAMTFAGWVHYAYAVGVAGALGVVAAGVFWWSWERLVLKANVGEASRSSTARDRNTTFGWPGRR